MKTVLLCLLFCDSSCAFLSAQDLAISIHDPSGVAADAPLTSPYQFPNTAVGGASQIVLRFSNASADPIQVAYILVGNTSGSAVYSPDFSITGLAVGKTLAVGAANFEDITLSFTPQVQGVNIGYLQATYQIQKNFCVFSSQDPATQCPSNTAAISTLQGTGLPPQIVLAYAGPNGAITPQPNSSTPISFGNISTSATSSLTFTLTNQSAAAITVPAVTLQTQVYNSTAFVMDSSALPATLAAGTSASFTIKFAPGQVQQANATLLVGALSYLLTGQGVVIAPIDALQIYEVDLTGVRILPQAATPISFGQVIAGIAGSSTLTFTVTNPITSFDPVALSALTVTGVGFATADAPAVPLSIAPGSSITFKVVFTPSTVGTYTGTLAIGTRLFSLSGLGITSAVPQAAFELSQQVLTSQQQVTLSIQLASASTVSAIGELAMTFTPSLTNVTDDPAINFLVTSGRKLQVNVAVGSLTATYNGQSTLTFQTGTTAGAIDFTLTFPNGAPVSKSFTILPQQIQITSSKAVRSDPNLVVTLTGFDNTYSAGKLAFTFFSTSGKQLTPTAIAVDSSALFNSYFFTGNKAGGAFSLQASFPVTGDITQVGSVTVGLTNGAGTSSTSQNF